MCDGVDGQLLGRVWGGGLEEEELLGVEGVLGACLLLKLVVDLRVFILSIGEIILINGKKQFLSKHPVPIFPVRSGRLPCLCIKGQIICAYQLHIRLKHSINHLQSMPTNKPFIFLHFQHYLITHTILLNAYVQTYIPLFLMHNYCQSFQ